MTTELPPPTAQPVEPAPCRKCAGPMRAGKALAQTMSGMPDFPGDTVVVTLSPGGPGVLIDCLKCANCGWSVTGAVPAEGATE